MMTETVLVLKTISDIRRTMSDEQYGKFIYELKIVVNDKSILHEAEQMMRKSKPRSDKGESYRSVRSVR